MVANYTPLKKKREEDAMSPNDNPNMRPDKPTIVYTNRLKEISDKPVVIGGVEASLRRFAHYDYWENKVRKSILLDSKADILVYGFSEKSLLEIVQRLRENKGLGDINGTVIKFKIPIGIEMPSFEDCLADKKRYAEYAKIIHLNTTKQLSQKHGDWYIVQNNAMEMTTKDVDFIAELPYLREAHPSYKNSVSGIRSVLFSVSTHRGCFGGCSFCAITYHQGKKVISRSEDSILREITNLTKHPEFKGEIFDLGAATANMWHMDDGRINHKPLISLMRKVRTIDGVKHVFVRSGIRFDLAMQDDEYMEELLKYHVSGNLKVAPEHVSKNICSLMGKPSGERFAEFLKKFAKITKKVGKPNQKVISYFMAAHPGCSLNEMKELMQFTKKNDCYSSQVQLFTPTPMTLSTAMYYTGLNPLTMQPIYVSYTYHEKKLQKAVMCWKEKDQKQKLKQAMDELEADN